MNYLVKSVDSSWKDAVVGEYELRATVLDIDFAEYKVNLIVKRLNEERGYVFNSVDCDYVVIGVELPEHNPNR